MAPRRKFPLKSVVVALATCFATSVQANPTGASVAAGQATIQQNGSTLTITNTPGTIINWQSFNINRGELTKFVQQNAQSQVLNRVTGVDPSQILGQLQSNGRVLLINPNGVLFGKGAQVDVAGLIVSTLQLKDADFLAGKLKFNDTPGAGSIKNEGTIKTASGGQVILIAPQIENSGLIHTPEGQIFLAAGKNVTIADPDKPAIQIEITNTEQKAINLGTLIGKEISLYGGLVKNSGTIQATTAVVGQNGKISLRAKYEVENTGTLQANGAQGGDIVVQAEQGTARVQGLIEAKALTPQQITLQQQTIEQKVQVASIVPADNVVVVLPANSSDISFTLQADPVAATPGVALDNAWIKAGVSTVIINTNTPQITQTTGPLAPLDSSPLNPNMPLLPNRQQGQGGTVRVMGRLVRIDDGAAIDATGLGAGGEILVGGGVSGAATPTPTVLWIGVGATLDASATGNGTGGKVILQADRIAQDGALRAHGVTGGSIEITAGQRFIQTQSSVVDASGDLAGGGIAIRSGQGEYDGAYISGALHADSVNGKGGDISVTGHGLYFAASQISADGATDGGQIRLGGDYQGQNPALANATTAYVNTATQISANGRQGQGGRVIVWSDSETTFGGTIEAKGVTIAQGGFVEISSKGTLHFAGTVAARKLLLDPKNIIIDAAGSLASFQLVDPNPGVENYFGQEVREVGSGNILVTAYGDSFAASAAGAAYLFNGMTGALISTLRGSQADDNVGSGLSVLNNGNYVVHSSNWANGAATGAGAVTWGNGSTGVSGFVSAANSLVGSQTEDYVGSNITLLSSGNYVINSPNWANGAATRAGAVSWGNGSTGTSGVVSAANSLVGSQTDDNVGTNITALSNGNYLVGSSNWSNGAVTSAGALTWGSCMAGVSGVVSATNSLLGTQANESVGTWGSFAVLSNGNYVAALPGWNDNRGAVALMDGVTGRIAVDQALTLSGINSIVGDFSGDRIGRSGLTALSNGNVVLASSNWHDNRGAVTVMDGATGKIASDQSRIVAESNSLTGRGYLNMSSIVPLASGEFLLADSLWNNGRGAVAVVDGVTGRFKVDQGVTMNLANSLVGSQQGDAIGRHMTLLPNGNVVLASQFWSNGGVYWVGAVTWVNGVTLKLANGSNLAGSVVSAANSLVGSQANDLVGSNFADVTVLSNGNYVVSSSSWSNAAGAVTWVNGSTGMTGVVSAANSLVGSQVGDMVGSSGITALSNGNYVVRSRFWANGAASSAGAVTWGNGSTGTSGVVSAANSLVGSQTGDSVGANDITVLSNGNYLVGSSNWANGAVTSAGALTWGSGTAGVSGVISASNSLLGTQANEGVGRFDRVAALSGGNYVAALPGWNGNLGAVALMDGATGRIKADQSLTVSGANSLVGGVAGDRVGFAGVTALADGNYVVSSPYWSGNRGAVTWGDANTGIVGLVTGGNSLIGTTLNDFVGFGGVTALSNGNFVVGSDLWWNGILSRAGAATWVNGMTLKLADGSNMAGSAVSAANSLVGSQANDHVGAGVTALSNGNYVVRSSSWSNGVGAATWGNGSTGMVGVVSAANSLVGSQAGDGVGTSITALSNGNYVVGSQNWANGAATFAGAATWGNGSTGTSGVVSAANSLVGSQMNDYVGVGGITALSNGNYLVRSYNWANGAATLAGAVSWGNGSTGTSGVVSAANSLVGSQTDDRVGVNGITQLSNGNYVVGSSQWNNGVLIDVGAATWGNGNTGVSGVVSAGNSLLGKVENQYLGNAVNSLGNGDYVVNANNAHAYAGGAWVNGTTGQVRFAGQLDDQVGSSVTTLTNGNFVVGSSNWSGNARSVGAATWVNGSTLKLADGSNMAGSVVSAANSLVGSQANDRVASGGVAALNNGNYVVSSYSWANGAATYAGAVTWGNGSTGLVGVVSAANSLVGSQMNDYVGGAGITALSNGNYLVRSSYWANGAATNAGAVTWGNGSTGTSGVVSAANSLVGSQIDDYVGGGGITALSNGNYLVHSYNWANGAATRAGAVSWGNGSTGVSGVVSAVNSLVGSQTDDDVGTSITALSNGNYLVSSDYWANGAATRAGAVTWGNGSTGISGVVSAVNSLVGSQVDDYVGADVTALSNGNFVVASSGWANGVVSGVGAVTWVNGSTLKLADGSNFAGGTISAANSLVGSQANDYVGGYGVSPLSNGNYLVRSASWSNGALANSGRVDIMPGSGGIFAQTFALNPSATATLNPAALTASLNAGTAVTLQANNDITINSAITVNNPSGNGGSLTMQAGRSILINANITTDNGALMLSANDPGANPAYRDAGTAHITMAAGTSINTGTGALDATLNGGTGTITFRNVAAGVVTASGATRNLGSTTLTSLDMSGGDLTIGAGASVIVSGLANVAAGNTLDLAGGSFTSGSLGIGGVFNLNGGTLSTGATTVASGGAFNLSSGTASFSGPLTLQAGGALNYALAGATTIPGASTQAGTLNIASGTLSFSGGLSQTAGGTTLSGGVLGANFAVSGGTLGGTGNITGNLDLTAGAYTLAAGDVLTVSGTTTLASGASLNLNGGGLSSSGMTLNGALTYTTGTFNPGGPLNINSGASFTKAGSGMLSLTSAFNELAGGSFVVNGGTLDLAAGGSLLGGSYSPAAGAMLRFSGGTFVLNGATTLGSGVQMAGGTFNGPGALTSTGILDITGNTTFNSLFTNSGTLTVSNGITLNASAGYAQTAGFTKLGTGTGTSGNIIAGGSGFALNGGILGGTGTVTGNISVGTATLAAGFSPGSLTITGNLNLNSTSTLNVELGGATAGSGYDVIYVGGTAYLAGTLNVTSWGGYVAAAGSSYNFLNFANSSGAFSSINLPAGWNISLNSTSSYLQLLMASLTAGAVSTTLAPTLTLQQALTQALMQSGASNTDPGALTMTDTAVGFNRVTPNDYSMSLAQLVSDLTQVGPVTEFNDEKVCR
jgi:filamentous hemagglutinin family protein